MHRIVQGYNYIGIVGVDSDGESHLANIDIGGKLRVQSVPYTYDIAEGNIKDHKSFSKYGINPAVGSTREDLWYYGDLYPFSTAARKMVAVSTNSSDSSTGAGLSGIRSINLYYLTTSFEEKSTTISLQGTVGVETVDSDIYRVQRVRANTCGTGGAAAGQIVIKSTGGVVYGCIPQGMTQQRSLVYTVPAGKTLFLTGINLSAGSTQSGKFCRFTVRANYDDVSETLKTFMYPFFEVGLQDNGQTFPLDPPRRFPTGTDIVVSVTAERGIGECYITGSLRGWEEKE